MDHPNIIRFKEAQGPSLFHSFPSSEVIFAMMTFLPIFKFDFA